MRTGVKLPAVLAFQLSDTGQPACGSFVGGSNMGSSSGKIRLKASPACSEGDIDFSCGSSCTLHKSGWGPELKEAKVACNVFGLPASGLPGTGFCGGQSTPLNDSLSLPACSEMCEIQLFWPCFFPSFLPPQAELFSEKHSISQALTTFLCAPALMRPKPAPHQREAMHVITCIFNSGGL